VVVVVGICGGEERRRESAAATAAGGTGRRPVPPASHPPARPVAVAHRAAFSSVCGCSPPVPVAAEAEREKESVPPLTEPRCCPPSIRPNRSISPLTLPTRVVESALFLLLFYVYVLYILCTVRIEDVVHPCAVFLQPILSTWLLLPTAVGLESRYHATSSFHPSRENVMFATGQGSPILYVCSFLDSAVFCIWGVTIYIHYSTLKKRERESSKVPLSYIVHPIVAAPTFWAYICRLL
jgi:hypothetical protein